MKIIHGDVASGGTVTGSSEVTTYEATKAVDPRLSRPWRSTGDTSEWLKVDLGAATDVGAVALVGHNLSSAAVVHVQAHTSDAWTSPSLDALILWTEDVLWHFFSAAQSYQWWRLTLADAANPDGYLQAGRWMLGSAYTSADPPRQELHETIADESLLQYSLSGQLYADLRHKRREYTINLGSVDETERQALLALYDSCGRADPVVALLDELHTDKLPPLYCVLEKPMGFIATGGWRWRHDGFSFREVF